MVAPHENTHQCSGALSPTILHIVLGNFIAVVDNPAAPQQSAAATSSLPESVTQNSANSASSTEAATPPTIAINGANPAIIHVGDTYNDLGATIAGPQADLNLGIQTFLNGTLTSSIVIDATQAATDTVAYVVTDQNGLTATSSRTIIIEGAANTGTASTTDATSTTAATSATSTAQ